MTLAKEQVSEFRQGLPIVFGWSGIRMSNLSNGDLYPEYVFYNGKIGRLDNPKE